MSWTSSSTAPPGQHQGRSNTETEQSSRPHSQRWLPGAALTGTHPCICGSRSVPALGVSATQHHHRLAAKLATPPQPKSAALNLAFNDSSSAHGTAVAQTGRTCVASESNASTGWDDFPLASLTSESSARPTTALNTIPGPPQLMHARVLERYCRWWVWGAC